MPVSFYRIYDNIMSLIVIKYLLGEKGILNWAMFIMTIWWTDNDIAENFPILILLLYKQTYSKLKDC